MMRVRRAETLGRRLESKHLLSVLGLRQNTGYRKKKDVWKVLLPLSVSQFNQEEKKR